MGETAGISAALNSSRVWQSVGSNDRFSWEEGIFVYAEGCRRLVESVCPSDTFVPGRNTVQSSISTKQC